MLTGLIALVFMIYGLVELFGSPSTPKNTSTANITGTLIGRPHRQFDGKSVEYIDISLNEYPGCRFKIGGDAMSVTKWGQMRNCLYIGDTVYLKVHESEYNDYLEWLDNGEHVFGFNVLAFKGKTCTFLTLSDYCKETSSNIGEGIFILLMGGALAFVIVQDIRKRIIKWAKD